MDCPLCQRSSIQNLGILNSRGFMLCRTCKLIFVQEQYRLGHEEERQRYMLHNNIESKAYVLFLRQAIDPALIYIGRGMKGLDFGCGPSPVLATVLNRMEILCEFYDPFFHPTIDGSDFDFVFSTECVEHFYYPRKSFERIDALMKQGGYLTIMTSLWDGLDGFAAWYYKNDPAHVAFYHADTLAFMAKEFQYDILYNDHKRVAIFRKG